MASETNDARVLACKGLECDNWATKTTTEKWDDKWMIRGQAGRVEVDGATALALDD